MPVLVVPYNTQWKKWFNELREPIWAKTCDLVVDIVHVGSTSIEGMSAKPVIDMDIVIDDWARFPQIVERLSTFGYAHMGNLGIKEREAFRPVKEPKYPHNLYVCHKDSVAYMNHILLRKHLQKNPDSFKRYVDLKVRLADKAVDVDEYCRLKTDLILEFLRAEGVPLKELDEIRSENLS
ncbi:hypothetical protein A3K78_06340 [Candidatus Bathyarchaeota archaeon RBG_13_52_12]|nr:MAG: hypothetical protein A3K78_06340 [Candidatus Bathyarchaeota archaeon RBG_13_52_12]